MPAIVESQTPGVPARPSIGVLRFRGMPAGSEADILGDGVSEDVIIELSRQADLIVVARQSSFQFNEGNLSAGEIGERLGVSFLLSGAVPVAGQSLRVTAHLINCATGHEVWAERYDGELKEIFAVQTEIARTVSATVAGRITEVEIESSGSREPEDLDSYHLVVKGIGCAQGFSAEAHDDAIAYFENAITL